MTSLSEQAYTDLRDRIVRLEFAPGDVLREDALQDRLGLGRTPIREALQRLAREHFITVIPRRGMFVSGIDEISELLAVPALTPVPGTQPWLLGVANVRGNLVPVIDLARFLFGERTQSTERTRLLVVRQGAGSVALMVDEVFGQRTVDAEQRRQAEQEEDPRLTRFVDDRVGEPRLAVFSMGKLVRAPDFRQAAA